MVEEQFDKSLTTNLPLITACIKYETLELQCCQDTYVNFCKKLGETAMDYTLFEVWFQRAHEERLGNCHPVARITPLQLRACIQYETIGRNKTVAEAYSNFCQKMGNMDYQEFQYYFYRYYNGKFDLEENPFDAKKTKLMQDLPKELIHKVLKNLDEVGLVVARHVCQAFRTVVDNQKPKKLDVGITWKKNEVQLSINKVIIKYQNTIYGCLIQYHDRNVEPRGDWMLHVNNDLKALMERQQETFELLGLNIAEENHLKELGALYKNPLKVTQFHLESPRMYKALEVLDLESLKEITLNRPTVDDVHYICRTPHWRQAEVVTVNNIDGNPEFMAFHHFKRVKITGIRIREIQIDALTAILLRFSSLERFEADETTGLNNQFRQNDERAQLNDEVARRIQEAERALEREVERARREAAAERDINNEFERVFFEAGRAFRGGDRGGGPRFPPRPPMEFFNLGRIREYPFPGTNDILVVELKGTGFLATRRVNQSDSA